MRVLMHPDHEVLTGPAGRAALGRFRGQLACAQPGRVLLSIDPQGWAGQHAVAVFEARGLYPDKDWHLCNVFMASDQSLMRSVSQLQVAAVVIEGQESYSKTTKNPSAIVQLAGSAARVLGLLEGRHRCPWLQLQPAEWMHGCTKKQLHASVAAPPKGAPPVLRLCEQDPWARARNHNLRDAVCIGLHALGRMP